LVRENRVKLLWRRERKPLLGGKFAGRARGILQDLPEEGGREGNSQVVYN
jgi:hypothetical protein